MPIHNNCTQKCLTAENNTLIEKQLSCPKYCKLNTMNMYKILKIKTMSWPKYEQLRQLKCPFIFLITEQILYNVLIKAFILSISPLYH